MKRLGIIQPGRIGDVIICLPIAKFYYDQGYTVIWPVAGYVHKHFADYIPYVNFIPVPDLNCENAYKIVRGRCNTIIDLTITFPNGCQYNDGLFLHPDNRMPFDEMKYAFANVPFEKKWCLEFRSYKAKEQAVFDRMVGEEDAKYTLLHLQGSSDRVEIVKTPGVNYVEIDESTDSVFDWCKVIEKAERIITLESCITTLIEQTNLNSCEKQLIPRTPDVRATYKHGNWSVLTSL